MREGVERFGCRFREPIARCRRQQETQLAVGPEQAGDRPKDGAIPVEHPSEQGAPREVDRDLVGDLRERAR
jgi:hypothetical protein